MFFGCSIPSAEVADVFHGGSDANLETNSTYDTNGDNKRPADSVVDKIAHFVYLFL